MTIAIGLKIGDGIILGADSAVTVGDPYNGRANYYYNAEKVINLVKGLPLGAVAYGNFGFAGRSTTRVAKDLRRRLSDPRHVDWVNPDNFTVEEVATKVFSFFMDLHKQDHPTGGPSTGFGLIVAGYAPNAGHGEIWAIDVDDATACAGPIKHFDSTTVGILWRGQGEALNRLIRGWSSDNLTRLGDPSLPREEVRAAFDSVAPLWNSAMPIQDGIDLVRYLAEVVAGFVRFIDTPTTVAPPIDVAAITLHEGFKWVQRKHYYGSELNREPWVHDRPHTPAAPEDSDG